MKPHFAAFGEAMLRLQPPGKLRLAQSLPGVFESSFAGAEANLCTSLALFGDRVDFLTALPDNPLTGAFRRQLRGYGVGADRMLTAPGRFGIFYVEAGAGIRPGEVLYDRGGSAIALARPEDYDFDAMLDGVDCLHLTGITPALSEAAYRSTLALARRAAERGARISFDPNFRSKLWRWRDGTAPLELAREKLPELLGLAAILIIAEGQAAELLAMRPGCGAVNEAGLYDDAGCLDLARQLAERFPRLEYIAIPRRRSCSAERNCFGALLYECRSGGGWSAPTDEGGIYAPYEIDGIVDRLGGGDAFAAGLLHGLYDPELRTPERAVCFAAAAGSLKLTVKGDANLVSKDEVMRLMRDGGGGNIKR